MFFRAFAEEIENGIYPDFEDFEYVGRKKSYSESGGYEMENFIKKVLNFWKKIGDFNIIH